MPSSLLMVAFGERAFAAYIPVAIHTPRSLTSGLLSNSVSVLSSYHHRSGASCKATLRVMNKVAKRIIPKTKAKCSVLREMLLLRILNAVSIVSVIEI